MIRIVVIEREFGAGAATIADMAARRLGWKLLDHALTEQIAQLAKISPETCRHREERIDSWLYRMAKVFWRGSHERTVGFPDTDIVDADQLICLSQRVIENAAQEGQCVIVGRAAAYFLRERPDTFCVFLYASRDFKYRRVLAEVKNEAEALKLVDTVDQERATFIRHYYKVEWPSRHLYHAMLNTAIGDEATVDTILNLIEAANRREAERGKS
ncbi:MAG TPA: cytidylate kinase-like family protein [Verrucomicrobiae bacterium]|jgi:cytidylate kinase|nr:cytidylate kinase-like family protein [Verrucomicrobiae bacterium]